MLVQGKSKFFILFTLMLYVKIVRCFVAGKTVLRGKKYKLSKCSLKINFLNFSVLLRLITESGFLERCMISVENEIPWWV
jgi:hypothetical protein